MRSWIWSILFQFSLFNLWGLSFRLLGLHFLLLSNFPHLFGCFNFYLFSRSLCRLFLFLWLRLRFFFFGHFFKRLLLLLFLLFLLLFFLIIGLSFSNLFLLFYFLFLLDLLFPLFLPPAHLTEHWQDEILPPPDYL